MKAGSPTSPRRDNPRHRVKDKGKAKTEPKPPRNAEIIDHMSVFHEMDNGDSRTSAIIAGSLVENNLALALMARFRILDIPQQKKLFDGIASALTSFSAKTQIGFAINLFGERVKDDLDTIREVRNAFAHHLYVRSFDHDEVKDKCDKLNYPKYQAWSATRPEITARRERFLSTAAHLAERFSLEARLNIMRPAEPRFFSYNAVWPFA